MIEVSTTRVCIKEGVLVDCVDGVVYIYIAI